MRFPGACLALLALLTAACEGRLFPGPAEPAQHGEAGTIDAGGGPVTAEVNPFTCEDDELPAELNARRLSRVEYQNAIRSLVERALGSTDTTALLAQLDLAGRLPPESVGSYSTSDTNFSVIHAAEYFGVADALATQLATNANYARFVSTYVGYAPGSCVLGSADSLSDACEDALIRNFLRRAWGRPVEETAVNENDELASFRREFQLAATSRAGVEALVVKALLAPQFLFHLQLDVRDQQGDVFALSSHAIARRLAFTFTQAPADEALLALAAAEDLRDDASFARAVALVEGRMNPTVTQFSTEWLHLDALPAFTDLTHPKSLRIREGVIVDDALQAAMRDETLELVRWVNDNGGTLSDVLTSDVSFARSPSLMRIYGQLAPAPDVVTAGNAVRFRPGERNGLLTRAAMLSSGGHTENPILRGVHIRQRLMCLSTPQPGNLPPNSLAPPLPDAQLTTRQRYHLKTAGAQCQGCHAAINPVGFALSQYDALGAYQAAEPTFDVNWQYVTDLPTDGRANLLPALGVERTVENGLQLGEVVASTSSLKSCLTRNYFTYVKGLQELPLQTQSCEMNRMYQSLSEGAPLRDFFKGAVLDRRFRQRTLRSTP